MIAREREKHLLSHAIAGTRSGQGRLLMISGEAGIGKTALVNWAIDRAGDEGLCVLCGYCHTDTASRPYGPWMDILHEATHHDVAHLSTEPLEDSLAKIDGFEAMADLVDRLLNASADNRAIMVVLEDAQWADGASIELLDHLSRNVRSRPVLMVITYRDDIDPEHELYQHLPTIARQVSVQRMSLQRLDDEDIRLLSREYCTLSSDDENRLLEFLIQRAEGNPFFAVELINMLSDQHVLYQVDGTWYLRSLNTAEVPALVHQIVSLRLAEFSPETCTLLETAAVAGNQASLDLLQHCFQGSIREIDVGLEQAIARRVLRLLPENETVQFSHELVRQSIYNAIPPMQRRRIHRQIGDHLASHVQPDVDEVADHLMRAGDELALPWLVRSARRARNLHTPEIVRQRCQQAIDLARRLGVRPPPEAHRLLGLALEMKGDVTGACGELEAALQSASEVNDTQMRWRVLLDLSSVWAAQDYDRSRWYIERALVEAQAIDESSIYGHTVNRLGNYYVNLEQFQRGTQAHQQALSIFENIHDEQGVANTLDLLGLAHVLSGDAAGSVTIYQRAIPMLRKLDERKALTNALITSAAAQLGTEHVLFGTNMQHRTPEASRNWSEQFDEAHSIAREIGWRTGESFCLALRAYAAHHFGHPNIALRDGTAALEISRQTGHHQWQILSLCSLGELFRDLEDLKGAQAHLEEAREIANETGSQFMIGLCTSFLASTCVAAEALEHAEALIEPVINLGRPPESTTQRNLWYAMVELQVANGATHWSLNLLEQLDRSIPGPTEYRSPRMLLLRGNVLTHAGRAEEAERALTQARDVANRFGYRPLLRSILLSLQRLYLQCGRSAEANTTLQESTSLAHELADALRNDAPDLAARFIEKTDAEPTVPTNRAHASPPSAAPGLLTRREREVLQVVAQGLTDVEVGEHLFISSRTVSQHLRSIYAKLEVNNRTAAVRAASRLGQLHLDED